MEKNCLNCKCRGICYVFYERYYVVKEIIKEKLGEFLSDREIEKICNEIKTILPIKCGNYIELKGSKR